MAQLRQDYEQFVARDAEVVVVGPDDAAAFARFWARYQIPFVGLPDPELTVLELLGQQVSLRKLGRMPAQLIVDKAGIARYAHYGSQMSDIPSSGEILWLLDQLNTEETK